MQQRGRGALSALEKRGGAALHANSQKTEPATVAGWQ
jgi:hypothetical protein